VIRTLLRHLLVDFLILVALLIASAVLPFISFWLIRDPVGAQIVFWAGPWVVAFWSVILYVLVGTRFWRGKLSVEDWKDRHGSYLSRAVKNTCWMFTALAFSYLLEFGVLWLTRSPGWMAVGTYFPVGFTILWSAARG
jgi:hypothetical protein